MNKRTVTRHLPLFLPSPKKVVITIKMWGGKFVSVCQKAAARLRRIPRSGGMFRDNGLKVRTRQVYELEHIWLASKPVNGEIPFDQFWKKVPTSKSHRDTVDHQLMTVNLSDKNIVAIDPGLSGLSGQWHVKGPGKERLGTRCKRFVQRVIYRIGGQRYKGDYYDDPRLLIQKEIVATNLYKAAKCQIIHDDFFSRNYCAHYTVDNKKSRFYGAFKHLEGFVDAGQLDKTLSFRKKHNPALELVLRRFLLGDEDYLKLDNYMYKKETGDLYSIDFGMAFYNKLTLKDGCDFQQFKARLLKPSKKHRLQYLKRDKSTLLALVKMQRPEEVDNAIKNALKMTALLDDQMLVRQLSKITKKRVRRSMLNILQNKRQQAQYILYKSFPEEFQAYREVGWPRQPGRHIMNQLV